MKARFAIFLVGLALVTGCTTSQVWNETRAGDVIRGSTEPELQLFLTPDRRDVLVTYFESREGSRARVPRAYYARANAARLRNNQKPEFAPPGEAARLQPIPLDPPIPNYTTSALTRGTGLRARLSASDHGFTLTEQGRELEYYPLPLYKSRASDFRKTVLTPFAVASDAVAIAACFLPPFPLWCLPSTPHQVLP